MKRVLVIGAVILVCASLASATIGFYLGQDYSRKKFFRMWEGSGKKERQFKDKIIARLDKKLGLDAQQHEKISQILENKQEQMRIAKDNFKENLKGIKDSTEAEIKSCLRPDQIEKFEKIKEERQRKTAGICGMRMHRKEGCQ